MLFFSLSGWALALIILAVMAGVTAAGIVLGRFLRKHSETQRELWGLAGQAIDAAPVASAPRLYVDSLNTTIDQQTVRISGLSNRVPTAVLALELIGAAIALGLLGFYLALLGRGFLVVMLVA